MAEINWTDEAVRARAEIAARYLTPIAALDTFVEALCGIDACASVEDGLSMASAILAGESDAQVSYRGSHRLEGF
jgi:hypothetical protein